MILSDFCDESGAVHTPVKLTGVSVHFVSSGNAPTLEQWGEKRAQILVSRRLMVVDMTLADLFNFTFQEPLVLIPGMLFEVLDAEARDSVRFEFEGAVLTPHECLDYFSALSTGR